MYSANRKADRLPWCLRRHYKSGDEAPAESVSSSLRKNQPWDNDMGLFGLKTGSDIARTFLTDAALTFLLLDSVYRGGNLFIILASLTALMIKLV
jgi:hypothetical protein